MLALLGPDVILNTMQCRVGVNLRRQNLFILSSVAHDGTTGKLKILLSLYIYVLFHMS